MRALSDPQLDYVFIAVAANMGFSAHAKEHLDLAVALERHVIVVVTKLDTCTKERLKETLRQVGQGWMQTSVYCRWVANIRLLSLART
jgi:GTPase